jgi:hypothetical protein
MVMMLLPLLSGIAAMNQFDDPCANPDVPLLDTQLTCTAPEPPETVPLIEMEDAVVELAGATTASSSGLAGAGVGAGAGAGAGLGLGLDALLTAAYNSWAAAMSLGIRTVCRR